MIFQKLNAFSPKTQGNLAKTQFFRKSEILRCRPPGQMETMFYRSFFFIESKLSKYAVFVIFGCIQNDEYDIVLVSLIKK